MDNGDSATRPIGRRRAEPACRTALAARVAAAVVAALCAACGGDASRADEAPPAAPAAEAPDGSALDRLWRSADGAQEAATEAAETARARVEELYRQARAAGESVPKDMWSWTLADIGRIGAWEYRIETLAGTAGEIQTELNALGQERWEAYWVERDATGLTVHLKRRARSYLERVPIGDLMRLVPRGAEG
jgi:hypothetical protein